MLGFYSRGVSRNSVLHRGSPLHKLLNNSVNLHVGQNRMKLQKSDTVLNPISIGEMLYVAITTI